MTKKRETETGWHFTGDTLRNGEPLPATGKWLTHKGAIKSGLHGSPRIIDALQYASGGNLHQCSFGGVKIRQRDKFVARCRRIDASAEMKWAFIEFSEACTVRAAAWAAAVAAEIAWQESTLQLWFECLKK